MSRKKREKGLPFFGIPKMIPFVRPFAKQMIGVMLLQLGMSLTDVARPLLQRYALNRFVGGSTLSGMVPFVLVYIAVISAGALVFYGSIKRTMKIFCRNKKPTLNERCSSIGMERTGENEM